MAKLLEHIVGHKKPIQKLLSAKQKNHLPHALLFKGPSGIGKLKTAFAFAQTLLCQKTPLACGVCPSCKQVEQKQSPHILFIKPEGLYIKTEAVRKVLKFLSLKTLAPARVIIIDSAHQLNASSANSLLKILEEPPEKTYFLLISSHPLTLPVTIRSRSQSLSFAPLSVQNLRTILEQTPDTKKNIQLLTEDENFFKASKGSMSHFNTWVENKNTMQQGFNLLTQVLKQKELSAWSTLNNLAKPRDKALFVCQGWQQIFRDAYLNKWGESNNLIHQNQKELLDILKKMPTYILEKCFQDLIKIEKDIKSYMDPALCFDYFLNRLNQEGLRT